MTVLKMLFGMTRVIQVVVVQDENLMEITVLGNIPVNAQIILSLQLWFTVLNETIEMTLQSG